MEIDGRQPGRFKLAWAALTGRSAPQAHVCLEELRAIRDEWREYELTLNSYMEKMNAWAARVAKREKRAAEKLLEAGDTSAAAHAPVPTSRAEIKAHLRRQLAAGVLHNRGLPQPYAPNGGDDP